MDGIKFILRIMIIVRVPLRISFVGGGTDLANFYHTFPGQVISVTTVNNQNA